MVQIQAMFPNGHTDVIQARQAGEAFDLAAAAGAVRIVDQCGELFVRIGGEFYGIPSPKGGAA